MSPLFRRKQRTREQVLNNTNEHPVDLILPSFHANDGFGKGFNIVKMIEEHAPKRIREIDAELDQINKKHADLTFEKMQLGKLITAIND